MLLTAVTTLFNTYVMRRLALLTGGAARSETGAWPSVKQEQAEERYPFPGMTALPREWLPRDLPGSPGKAR